MYKVSDLKRLETKYRQITTAEHHLRFCKFFIFLSNIVIKNCKAEHRKYVTVSTLTHNNISDKSSDKFYTVS